MKTTTECEHPAARQYAWVAQPGTDFEALCTGCLDCGGNRQIVEKPFDR